MKAVIYHGKEDMRLEQVADPEIVDPTDLVLRVERTAICGSDLHLWHSDVFPETGFVVGHEFLGTVEDAGADVQSVKRGDRVLVSCTTGCGRCRSCQRQLMSGCAVTTDHLTHTGVFGYSNALAGGQAEAVRVPFADTNCFLIPAALDDEEALFLTDILPTGYMAAEMAEVSPGDVVVVFGCGPVGTFAQQSAFVRGAATVVAVDLDESRLRRAEERGCLPCNPAKQELLPLILELTQGQGADAAIEAVGIPELITQAALVTRPGACIAVAGVIFLPYEIAWPLFFAKNLTLRTGLVNPQAYFHRLVPLIAEGRLNPKAIISHRLALDQAVEGYEIFANRRDDVLKVVLSV